jgi:hypothetical protein
VFPLTDDAIETGIDIIAGFLVAQAAAKLGRPVEEIAEAFYASHAYAQLSDPRTGRYWDSLSESLDLFLAEFVAQ